jgi:hypothetical protein
LAKIQFSLVCPVLALAGCGSRTTMGGREAGTSSDSAVMSDTVVVNAETPRDIILHDDVVPDVVVLPDAVPDVEITRPDVPIEAAPSDVVPPETPPDSALRDGPSERQSPDRDWAPDIAVFGDGPALDLGADLVSRESESPDVAGDLFPETAREVQPFVIDGAPASFCSGDSAHMIVNGIESYPVVTGRMLPLDCCDAGLFTVTTQTFSEPISFRWQRFSGIFQYPVAVDLANPPSEWSLWLIAGCDPMKLSCTTQGDTYTTGFTGLLEVVGNYSQLDMSLCLHVQEPSDSPHSIIHTLDLYAPHVLTSY